MTSDRRTALLVPTLVFVGLLVAIVSSLGAPLIPTIAHDDQVPLSTAQWVLTAALLNRHLAGLLPGVWCVCYAMGLIASRAMVPRGVLAVAGLFGAAGTALLFAQDVSALRWWVMPGTFGLGQLLIGLLVLGDDLRHQHEF